MCKTNESKPRLTVEEINQFNPSPERPLEVECDDGYYVDSFRHIKIIGPVQLGEYVCIEGKFSPTEGIKATRSVYTLEHYPSIKDRLGFQVGDKVRAFGVDGVVKSVTEPGNCPVDVEFSTGNMQEFTQAGRERPWHKEPSLILVERPVKKVKKSFWMWADKQGSVMDYLMDESGVMPSSRPALCKGDIGLCTKIPGTEVVLEVEVK